MKDFTPVALAALLMTACASQSAVAPGAGSARSTELVTATDARYRLESSSAGVAAVSLPAEPDRVWAALPEAYAAIGLNGTVLDQARRVFGQPEVTVRRRMAGEPISRWLNCGTRAGLSNADAYSVNIVVRTQVLPDGQSGSRVRTEVEATARAPGSSELAVRCGSTYALENRIEEELRKLTR